VNAKPDELRGSFGRKLLPALGLFLTGAVTVVFGIGLARLIVTPNYGWAMTITGISFYLLAIAANPLLGFLVWIVTAPFSRFYFLDILMGRVCGLHNDVLGCSGSHPESQNPSNQQSGCRDDILLPGIVGFCSHGRERAQERHCSFRRWICHPLLDLFLRTHAGPWSEGIAIRAGRVVCCRWLSFGQGGVRKLSGLLGNPAHFGTILGMIVPFTIRSVLNSENPSKRVFGAVLAALEIWAIYLTYNRGSWLGFVLSMLFMFAFYPRFRRLALPLFLIVVVVAALGWPAISSSPVFQERLGAKVQVTYRLEVYQIIGKLIQGNYLFGLGLGGFDVAYLRVVKGIYGDSPWPARMMPHNAFLYVLFVAGVVALVPFTLVFLFMIWDGYVLWRRAQEGDIWIDPELIVCFGAALIVYLTQSMVIDMMASLYPNMIFFVIMGVMYGVRDALPPSRKPGRGSEELVEVHIS